MKAVVAAFNQEKALVGAFSVITNFWMDLFEALCSIERWPAPQLQAPAQGQGQPGVPLVITTHCGHWTLDTAADTRILSLFAIHPKYNHWLADNQF